MKQKESFFQWLRKDWLCKLLIVIICVVIFSFAFSDEKCNKWHPENHCDALCGDGRASPKGDGWDVWDREYICLNNDCSKYKCICKYGIKNVTTSETCV